MVAVVVTVEGEFFNGVATAVLRIGTGKGDAAPFAVVVGYFLVADVEMGKPGGGPDDLRLKILRLLGPTVCGIYQISLEEG